MNNTVQYEEVPLLMLFYLYFFKSKALSHTILLYIHYIL